MTEFCRKSLATSEFDMTLENYVYTVHDLQLEYLKSQLRDDEEKEKVKCTLQYFWRKIVFKFPSKFRANAIFKQQFSLKTWAYKIWYLGIMKML